MREKKGYDTVLAFGIIGLVLLMIIPLNPSILDLLLSFSLVLSVMTLLLTLYVKRATDFSSFPSLLLFLAFFRLGLNIASARLILTKAYAGNIIATFGNFVSSDSPFIGFVLFVFLMIINFIVITKGSGRIAEVAARFVLEAMPGKQMAIDAEVNAHTISHDEARKARQKIALEAEFYGAMDGASKFVRGEAIASLLITALNIFGGIFVAATQQMEPISVYLSLSIGDGLISQIPALLVSLGAGIILTKVSEESLNQTIPKQVLRQPKVFLVSSLFMATLGCMPGMPKVIFFPISFFLGIYYLKTKETAQKHAGIEVILGAKKTQWLPILRNKKWDYDFLPEFSFRIDKKIHEDTHQIKIKGVTQLISVGAHVLQDVENIIANNYTHFINRQYVAEKIEAIRSVDAALVTEIHAKKISLGTILNVVLNLLKEKVPIHDFHTLLSVIADAKSFETDHLVEKIREKLSKAIFQHHFGDQKHLFAVTLDPEVEEMLAISYQNNRIVLRPKTLEKLENAIVSLKKGEKMAVLTGLKTRLALARLLEKQNIPVFSFNEIDEEIEIKSAGTISNEVLI